MRKSGSFPDHLGPHPVATPQRRQLGQALRQHEPTPEQSFWRGRLAEKDRFDQLLFSIGHTQEVRAWIANVTRQGGEVQFEYGDGDGRVNTNVIWYHEKDLAWLLSVADDAARQNIKVMQPCQRLMIEGEQYSMTMQAAQAPVDMGDDDEEGGPKNQDAYL